MTRPTLEDRQNACRRPDGHPVMYQTWSDLAFLHWIVEPEAIASTLPRGLHVDTHEDKAYLGLVPFYMRDIRLRGFPKVSGTANFLEMNVRTYVHDDRGVPGVWFYSLDADNSLACAVANRFFSLPYFPARMSASRDGEWIDYRCNPKRGRPEHVSEIRYRGTGENVADAPGSLEYFLAERYRLFAWHPRKRKLSIGAVSHAPYRLEPAEASECSPGALDWCGFEMDGRPADQAHFSPGVDVEVFPLQPLPQTT